LISWTPGTNGDIVNYDILEWVPGTGWNSIATVPNTVSMPYPLPGAAPGSMVKRYKVMSTDSCGNQSSDLLVSAHNNMLLTENMDPCEGIMRLRWNQYNGWAGGVKEYRVLADVTPPGGPTQTGVLLATKAPGDTAFNTRDLIGGWSYCYYIRAVDTAGQRFSSSNEVCINSLAVQRSRLLYLAKTSVRNDNAVELVTFIDKDADIIHFDLQRADRDGAPFTSLGLIPKPVSPPWEIRFKDFSADPVNHRYLYRFVATDSCGGIDTASNIGTNILLEVEPADNLTNILTWNPYRDFMGGVLKYDIYRSIGEGAGMNFVGTTTDTIFTDNIRPTGDNVGIFCYKVVATEGPSLLNFTDYDGSVFTSVSNVACAEHKPRIFIPNSFSPNSPVAENRTWRPKQVYVESGSYKLEILDRWGNVVFSTSDENVGWDGTIDGVKASEGSYLYQLNFRSKQGEPIEMLGTLLLIY
jgi:gliding motility-associated-like protein